MESWKVKRSKKDNGQKQYALFQPPLSLGGSGEAGGSGRAGDKASGSTVDNLFLIIQPLSIGQRRKTDIPVF